MRRIFVSGCFDILHAGHTMFFKQARALGDHLTVSVASDEVLRLYKGRLPSLPLDNKVALIESLRDVDRVVISSNEEIPLDFRDNILADKPHVLVVNEDDLDTQIKSQFCHEYGIELIIIPRIRPANPVSTTSIRAQISGHVRIPLRVDFAGGWLDVPKFSRSEGYIVNCTIEPLVGLDQWHYRLGGGLGGSAAQALLRSRNAICDELATGVGWQDAAVIGETGLCVWRSGKSPVLDFKVNPDWLSGLMLLYWTRASHHTPNLVDIERDFSAIVEASQIARVSVLRRSVLDLAEAINTTYRAQLNEGMTPLPDLGSLAMKYAGSGHGGYALYLFDKPEKRASIECKDTLIIEPYIR